MDYLTLISSGASKLDHPSIDELLWSDQLKGSYMNFLRRLLCLCALSLVTVFAFSQTSTSYVKKSIPLDVVDMQTISGGETPMQRQLVSTGSFNKDFADNSAAYRGYPTVQEFGAKSDGQSNATGSIATGSSDLRITGNPSFSSSDIGKMIAVVGASSSGSGILFTTIKAFVSYNSVVLVNSATATCRGSCNVLWGTDNTTAFNQATIATGAAPTAFTNQSQATYIRVPSGVYFFSGTTPIYVRGGEFLVGDHQTSSQLYTFATGTNPLIQVGTNSSGTSDGSGLATGVYGLFLNMPFSASGCLINIVGVSGWLIEDNAFESGGSGICISSGNTIGSILGNGFDSNLFNGISASGNGMSTNADNHSVIINSNMFFAQRFSAINLEGVTDYTINGNQFLYAHQYSIFGNQRKNNFRISITNNNFLTSADPKFYTATQTHIYFNTSGPGGLINSVISGNTFYLSRNGDIFLDGAGTGGNIITNNVFDSSARNSTAATPLPSVRIAFSSSSSNILNGNQFVGVGGSAVSNDTIAGPVVIENNTCLSPFVGGIPASPANACFLISAASGIVKNNITDGNKWFAVSFAGGAGSTSFGNISSFSDGDILIQAGAATATTTGNERVNMGSGILTNSGRLVPSTNTWVPVGTCKSNGFYPVVLAGTAVHLASCN
jgi:hypothetical protein